MKKMLFLSFLLLPTFAVAVSVKLTVRDLPATGVKKGSKLIAIVDSRAQTAEEQILFSAEVRADGKKYAKVDKQRFDVLRAKLLLLGVVLDDGVMKAWMDSPLNLTGRSLQHQFIHRGYALTFIEHRREMEPRREMEHRREREHRGERGFHVVHYYFFKSDN